MNPKLILCLALVLSGGLSGCSTMPGGALGKSAEGKLFGNQAAICLPSDDSSRPWNLDYALTEPTVNERELFVTVHSRGEVDRYEPPSKWRPEYTAAIYVKVGKKLRLLKRLSLAGQAYFRRPVLFPAHFERADTKDDWKQLIQITEVCYGSGGLTTEHFFTPVVPPVSDLKFEPDVELEEVGFTPASESYPFGKDEVLKDEFDTFSENALSFEFHICKLSGRDFRPIAKVTGAYKLEQKSDGKLRITTGEFKRERITNSDCP